MSTELDQRKKFLAGMSHAACTVSVVTTDGIAGKAGVTISAMASVSADTPKPTLLVCVHQKSAATQKILDNNVFCVNVLRDDQSYISDTFAGRFKDQVADKFDCTRWTVQKTGAPRVVDPLVAFDCSVLSSHLIGTHQVLFGEVEDLFVADQGSPLIYTKRNYGAATPIESPTSIRAGIESASRRLSVACFHSFGPSILPSLVHELVASIGTIEFNLVEGDDRRVRESLLSGETEVALLYDFDLSDDFVIVPLAELWPYVLLAEANPLTAHQELTPKDLEGHQMILLSTPPSRDYFLRILRNAGVEPNIAYRSTSFETVRGMVAHGLGYTLLATRPASAMSHDGRGLVTRPMKANVEASRVVLAYRRGISLSNVAQEFIAHSRDFFGGRPMN